MVGCLILCVPCFTVFDHEFPNVLREVTLLISWISQVLVGKKGGGFWEGGKGTRDKARMSRKDPRKYKRRGGAKVGS